MFQENFITVVQPILFLCMRKLKKVYKGLGEEQKLFILPFGTKPMALGACAFIVEHNCKNKLSILFDRPQKKKERSYDIGTWNLYRIIYG